MSEIPTCSAAGCSTCGCDGVLVEGKLEVVDHPPAFDGAVLVPAWREVRVVGRHVGLNRE